MGRAVRGILLLCVRQKIPGEKPVVCSFIRPERGVLTRSIFFSSGAFSRSVFWARCCTWCCRCRCLPAALTAGIVKLEQVKETGTYLTGIFPLLFVPAAAGIMELWAEMGQLLLPILIAILPVTVLVMAAAGRTTQALTARNKKEEADHDGTAE